MIFKSYILEQSFQSIKDCKLFLFYGENYGLKKEFKERIKINTKSYETINLNQDEIIDNKNILINEVVNKSLFNDKKIVFINQANDKILNILEEIIEKSEIKMVIQINGKTRDIINIKRNLDETEVVSLVKKSAKASKHIKDKTISRIIFVKNKIINYIV